MRMSRVEIKNFRSFRHLDVELGYNVILLGENGVGKTNFLEALRLVLDPSRERRLYRDDFHRPGTPFEGNEIEVHVYFTDFGDDKRLLKVFSDCFVEDDPPVAQVSYVYCPKEDREPGEAKGRDDYHAIVYGAGDRKNKVRRAIHEYVRLRLIPALRDIDKDIAVWQSSPLRRLVDLMGLSEDSEFIAVANDVRRATARLQRIDPIERLQEDIRTRLVSMVEGVYRLDPQIGMLSSDPDELQKALRLFIDENLSLERSSLGLANVLYLTLLMLEIEHRKHQLAPDEDEGEKYEFTILAVEEPEAHLHPHLQRLVFGDFLRYQPLLLSTHSPHIVSVAEPDSFVLLKDCKSEGTKATSTARLSKLQDWQLDWDFVKRDLARYLDAIRGEVVFAKAVILVEGDAELFLIPEFAKCMKEAGIIPYTLDGCGVSVCSVSGTDFVPYTRFLGPSGLNLPLVIITDGDKHIGLKRKVDAALGCGDLDVDIKQAIQTLYDSKEWDALRTQLENAGCGIYEGLRRGVDLVRFLCPDSASVLSDLELQYGRHEWEGVRTTLAKLGVFVNDWTLEIELTTTGYQDELVTVYGELGASDDQKNNMMREVNSRSYRDLSRFIARIEETGKGKGRFAQRLADKVDPSRIPPYIKSAIEWVVNEVASADSSQKESSQEQEWEMKIV